MKIAFAIAVIAAALYLILCRDSSAQSRMEEEEVRRKK